MNHFKMDMLSIIRLIILFFMLFNLIKKFFAIKKYLKGNLAFILFNNKVNNLFDF